MQKPMTPPKNFRQATDVHDTPCGKCAHFMLARGKAMRGIGDCTLLELPTQAAMTCDQAEPG